MSFNLITDLSAIPRIKPSERGLHYGDGLFETLLIHQGVIHYWQEHYDRLKASCQRLNILCPDQSWLEQQLQGYIDLNESLVIKIIITRGDGGRGLSLPENTTPNVYIFKYSANLSQFNQSVKLIISEITLPDNQVLAGIKHLNRLLYVLAAEQLQSHSDYDEALLLDTDGFMIESIVHNLFFIREDIVYTPDLTKSGVEGVMRKLILKKLKALGKAVKIGYYTPEHLLKADECFLCNSVQGIRPIIRMQNQIFKIGPVTRLLQQSIHGI
ncbi:MAG: aminodeoxychorismate lyase [Gammaproteobacteria bacterium]|nr:aminodeoxychorismate lyase [Gammaproteobacteria bacterium]